MSNKKDNELDNLLGLDDFKDDQSRHKAQRRARSSDSGHTLLTFLERESKRLGKTLDFIENKVFSLKNFPQDQHLIRSEEIRQKELRDNVLKKLADQESIITKNIHEILQNHYNH